MLNGSLDTFALPDVLRFVAAGGVTGRLEINRGAVGGELSVDQGRFVAARLGEDEAPTTLDEALDVAVLLFDGSGGTFQVVQEEWVGGPLDLDAEELVKAVERRREQWAAVVQVLGSLEDPLILANELPSGTNQITISAAQWRLLTLVDGNRSVQDIARDSASSVYATGVSLSELANGGLVERGTRWEGATETPEPEEEDPAEVLHDDTEEMDEPEEETPQSPQPDASVRPLRAPTREEQRIHLRR